MTLSQILDTIDWHLTSALLTNNTKYQFTSGKPCIYGKLRHMLLSLLIYKSSINSIYPSPINGDSWEMIWCVWLWYVLCVLLWHICCLSVVQFLIMCQCWFIHFVYFYLLWLKITFSQYIFSYIVKGQSRRDYKFSPAVAAIIYYIPMQWASCKAYLSTSLVILTP